MPAVREPAVAGMFYPAQPAALRAQVAACLESAGTATAPQASRAPKLCVVPHAGYVYSGPIAAHAYAQLEAMRDRIRRVVLLGPSHRVPFEGLAAPESEAFDTPLGRVRIDTGALDELDDLPQVVRDDMPHAAEHALEVQLPFLQTVLDDFELVPLVVGDASADEVAQVVERLWGGDETLLLVSSDLSHYLSYAQAQAIDTATVQRIVAFDASIATREACGAIPLNGALLAARRHGLAPRVLDLRNSGDTAGDRRRVVGYAALSFEATASHRATESAEQSGADTPLGAALLGAARNAIAARLGLALVAAPLHRALDEPGACFVTLRCAGGDLRGCIGRLSATRRLGDDVRANARAAAFDDPRFSPLQPHEWKGLTIEVSVVDPPVALPACSTQALAFDILRPGTDGVVLEWRGQRAALLPQVWRELSEPCAFFAALKRKAGLAADFWADDIRLSRFEVRSFGEMRG